MRTIYIDSDYKCYTVPAEGRTPVETDVFNGKCKAYVEGFRFIPEDYEWRRYDGYVFHGEMISAWKDSKMLELAQSAYEESLVEMQNMREALELLTATEE